MDNKFAYVCICLQPFLSGHWCKLFGPLSSKPRGSQGLFYDSQTYNNLANTSGMDLALRLYQRMYVFAYPITVSQYLASTGYESTFTDGR